MTKALRVLVVDDEQPARARVLRLLHGDPRFEVAGEAVDGVDALERLERLLPDIVVLDIQMPGLGGFEVLDAIRGNLRPIVVFSTAFDSHALRAFDAHAIDYLLKPYTAKRFAEAMDKARAHRLGSSAQLAGVIAQGVLESQRLTLKTADGPWVTLALAEIVRVEAANKHTCVATAREEHLVRRSLSEVADRLDARFVQVHRGAIINVDMVRKVSSRGRGDALIELSDGSSVLLTRSFRAAFFARHGQGA